MIRYHERSLRSKYQNLVVSGCSFTHNEHHTHVTWGNTLAYWTGMSIRNHAVNGAGSSHISTSVILDIEKTQPDPADTLILVMWSSLGRIDFIVDRASCPNMREVYHYDRFNQLAQLRFLPNLKKPMTLLQDDHSYVLRYWLDIQSLTSYLTCKGYRFLYTSIFDLSNARQIDYGSALQEIDLTFDRLHWLPLSRDRYLGNWAKAHGLVAEDGWHPTREAQELWTQEVLVPQLRQLEIIYE